jgi:isopentenyl-diphosphate delta-isomerase type 1
MNTYDTSSQMLILVDEQDNEIGTMAKTPVHEQGLLHRAFSVMLYRHNDKGQLEVLLQKRHTAKYHCGGLWTNTCCSHPAPGETTLAAAERRLFEEIGIQIKLEPKGSFRYIAKFANGLTEHELDHVFVAEYHEEPKHFNRTEISEMRWVTKAALERALDETPHLYTPWLPQVLHAIEPHKIC